MASAPRRSASLGCMGSICLKVLGMDWKMAQSVLQMALGLSPRNRRHGMRPSASSTPRVGATGLMGAGGRLVNARASLRSSSRNWAHWNLTPATHAVPFVTLHAAFIQQSRIEWMCTVQML